MPKWSPQTWPYCALCVSSSYSECSKWWKERCSKWWSHSWLHECVGDDLLHVRPHDEDQVVWLGGCLLLLHLLCQHQVQWWHQADHEQLHVVHLRCGHVLLAEPNADDSPVLGIREQIKGILLQFDWEKSSQQVHVRDVTVCTSHISSISITCTVLSHRAYLPLYIN